MAHRRPDSNHRGRPGGPAARRTETARCPEEFQIIRREARRFDEEGPGGSHFRSKEQYHDRIGSHEAAFSAGKEAATDRLLRELGR
ncbi:hypothetical protein ACW4TU_02070 [Streptomyces sp. QTS52]